MASAPGQSTMAKSLGPGADGASSSVLPSAWLGLLLSDIRNVGPEAGALTAALPSAQAQAEHRVLSRVGLVLHTCETLGAVTCRLIELMGFGVRSMPQLWGLQHGHRSQGGGCG